MSFWGQLCSRSIPSPYSIKSSTEVSFWLNLCTKCGKKMCVMLLSLSGVVHRQTFANVLLKKSFVTFQNHSFKRSVTTNPWIPRFHQFTLYNIHVLTFINFLLSLFLLCSAKCFSRSRTWCPAHFKHCATGFNFSINYSVIIKITNYKLLTNLVLF